MTDQTPGNDPYAAPTPPASDPYAAPSATPYTAGAGSAPAKSPILSILSLVGGILGIIVGFFGWGLLFSIAGVVLGHLGRKREPNGRGMALGGLITGYVGIAINIIVIAIAIIAIIALGAAGSYNSY
ncbi:DUF4190 domain-containing protein [Amnibacterium flavum]|nr:DUF4190 domain-containing protein [Amnibacterium flavum]